MTPARLRAQYRRMLGAYGETVTLRRTVPNGAPIEASALARVTGYQPNELVSGIEQGDRKVILLAEDVETSGFPVPFKTSGSDKIVARGTMLSIEAVDDSTRRVASVLIAYELRVRG
ncbi:MAG: hypothetical protein ACTHJ3_07665 [Pararhizobium sp.]